MEYTNDNNNLEIHIEDVVKAVRELKNDKAPGPGNIPAELIKCGTCKLFQRLRYLMQDCLDGGKVTTEWKESWVSPIYKKKGRKDECDNYRGLSVAGTISKVNGEILKAKIEGEWKEHEAEEQAGFRAGRSTIDLQKAYDSVPLMKLWEALN